MKKLFLNLLFTLLSVISFSLLLPATRVMIDLMKTLGPDIITDLNKGSLSFVLWLQATSKSLATTLIGLPLSFWVIVLAVYFTKNVKARAWITQTQAWLFLKKWQGAFWPLVLPLLMVWSMFTDKDFSFPMIFSLVFVGPMCVYASLSSYLATKKGENYWTKQKQG